VLGGVVAVGNRNNPSLTTADAARLSIFAGVTGDVNLAQLALVYGALIALNDNKGAQVLAFYKTLNEDKDRAGVLGAADVTALAAHNSAYAPYVGLLTPYPEVLATYQKDLRGNVLPLGPAAAADATAAERFYALLNNEIDIVNVATITSAKGLAALVEALKAAKQDYQAYLPYVSLDQKYPLVFSDYQNRRRNGAPSDRITPIVFSQALQAITTKVVPETAASAGDIYTYLSSIQTYGSGSFDPNISNVLDQNPQGSIDLWAPNGKVVAGLTTPAPAGVSYGVVTNAGGSIRSVIRGDFSINLGKVLTALGGDIELFSEDANIDAGKGARTALTTPSLTLSPVLDGDGNITSYLYSYPASAIGSGIQALTYDPDGSGPRVAPPRGSAYLFTPAGVTNAGEAGISAGKVFINALVVLNAANITAPGGTQGVPKVESGSLATTLATSGGTASASSQASQDAAAAAAARAPANTTPVAKPTILSVEVLGFGDKNCKEDDKDCFAK
jgi:hypothetical protein